MHKAVVSADFGSKTILVDDPWLYVELWLKRNKKSEALFYWEQAREFYQVAKALPPLLASLPSYYCFLNAVKALLIAKNIRHGNEHGLSGTNGDGGRVTLERIEVHIKSLGVAGALSRYLGEVQPPPAANGRPRHTYNLRNILFNLPFIHRSYCLTYNQNSELFIPIYDPYYVQKNKSFESWFSARLPDWFDRKNMTNTIPDQFEIDEGKRPALIFRTKNRFRFRYNRKTAAQKATSLRTLKGRHQTLRLNITYITSIQRIWYLRRIIQSERIINRYTLTLMLAVMHRMSELTRYDPMTLNRLLSGRYNFLLTEFITLAPRQFIDEISSEITGLEFMMPGYRG